MLEVGTSVVVIIDIQEKLVKAVSESSPVQKLTKICEAAKILDIPTIVTEQYPKGLGETVEVLKGKLPNGVQIIEKTAFSALSMPEFSLKLKQTGKKQVVIAGIEAHICVYQTVCSLIDEGYEVYVLKDGCASRNTNEFDAGIDLMKQSGAKITSCEIVLFEWLKTSNHPNFKAVQALVKC